MSAVLSVPAEPVVLREGQLADALQVSVRTVRRWRAAGAPCLSAPGGHLVRYSLPAILQWLQTYAAPTLATASPATPPRRGRPRRAPSVSA